LRLFDVIEIPYLPANELFDISLVGLGNPNIGICVSDTQLFEHNGVLHRFIESIKDIELNYIGKKSEEIDIDTSTNRKVYLSKAIFET
jgi:hypothetical protein